MSVSREIADYTVVFTIFDKPSERSSRPTPIWGAT